MPAAKKIKNFCSHRTEAFYHGRGEKKEYEWIFLVSEKMQAVIAMMTDFVDRN
jgi:hypothetical protein